LPIISDQNVAMIAHINDNVPILVDMIAMVSDRVQLGVSVRPY
jgi:hypothetical protein